MVGDGAGGQGRPSLRMLLFQHTAAAVLDGLGNVLRADVLRSVQVSDGPGHPQYAVMAAAGETQAVKGTVHDLFALFIQDAVFADHRRGHVSVAGNLRPGIARLLHGPGSVYPPLNIPGTLRGVLAAHGLIVHRRHLDVQVDAVQQRAGDAAHIALHLPLRAGASVVRMAVPAAPAGIHGAHQHKTAG